MTVPEVPPSDTSLGLRLMFGADGFSEAPRQIPTEQLQRLSPNALAYLGDAVYELFVRGSLLVPPSRIQYYHRQVVAQVRAETQARHLLTLMPHLNEAEQEVLRRGRNASPRGPRRLDAGVYQQATSFETLVGYLYLCDPQRLALLLSRLDLTTP